MSRLRIRHLTTYAYGQAVEFQPHRLLLRPRESRDLRLLSNTITCNLPSRFNWSQDVFGNAVASVSFSSRSDRLEIDSVSEVDLSANPWPVFDIAASAISYPFLYEADDWTDLGALTLPQYPDPHGGLRAWAQSFVARAQTDTLSLLKDLSHGVANAVQYQAREVEGTQAPLESLTRGLGSCRDMAVLFIEAARTLGFGGRIVSGYLHNPDLELVGVTAIGCTHAWAEIFLPGAGWITFDPTNRSVGGANLIAIAVGRGIRQVTPVEGAFIGPTNTLLGLWVEVSISPML